jgi:hypothetical protein
VQVLPPPLLQLSARTILAIFKAPTLLGKPQSIALRQVMDRQRPHRAAAEISPTSLKV